MAPLVYVDHMVVGNISQRALPLSAISVHAFHIKDLRSLKYFLGVEVIRLHSGLVNIQCANVYPTQMSVSKCLVCNM